GMAPYSRIRSLVVKNDHQYCTPEKLSEAFQVVQSKIEGADAIYVHSIVTIDENLPLQKEHWNILSKLSKKALVILPGSKRVHLSKNSSVFNQNFLFTESAPSNNGDHKSDLLVFPDAAWGAGVCHRDRYFRQSGPSVAVA